MATMATETSTAKAASMATETAATIATTTVAAAVPTIPAIAPVPAVAVVAEGRTIVGAAVPTVTIPTAIAIGGETGTQGTQGKNGSEEKNQFCFHIVTESDAVHQGLFSKSLHCGEITWIHATHLFPRGKKSLRIAVHCGLPEA